MTAPEPAWGTPAWWDIRYSEGSKPWDRGIVAPEVAAFAADHPGNDAWAIDIGCGTGVHGRELARHGYRVAGIDLSLVALRSALAAALAEGLPWVGVRGSATELVLFRQMFTVALDVGCFHGIPHDLQPRYAEALARRLQPGGHFLVYAVHPRDFEEQGGPSGVAPARIEAVFNPTFETVWRQEGWQGERRADWWLLRA